MGQNLHEKIRSPGLLTLSGNPQHRKTQTADTADPSHSEPRGASAPLSRAAPGQSYSGFHGDNARAVQLRD